MTAVDTAQNRFEHDALLYASDDEFTAVLGPLVRDALAASREVIAVVPQNNQALLFSEIGRDGDAVTWIDSRDWYRHPAHTIAGYDRTLKASTTNAFVIGEVEFGSTPRDWIEWTRYESTLNEVFSRYSARVICPYNVRTLPQSVVADASCTHPHLLGTGGHGPSQRYVDPTEFVRQRTPIVELPEREPDVEIREVGSVRECRQVFSDVARRVGISDERIDELVIAFNELATNAIVHGGGVVTLRLWGGSSLVCVIDDGGAGLDDPLAGFRAPTPDAEGGYGLWLARLLINRVELATSPAGGLRVCLMVDGPR